MKTSIAYVKDSKLGNVNFHIEEINPESVTSYMPVTSDILNPFGLVRAGAMISLADITAIVLAIGDQTIGDDGKGFPLIIDVHSTIVSNQRGGEIRAKAEFIRKGNNVMVIKTRVTGYGGKLLAEVTSTHIKAARVKYGSP